MFGFFETKCANDADDLVQSTFLACMKAREQFRAESSFRTYLFTIFEAPTATIRTRLHPARKALGDRVQGQAPPDALETLETMDAWARRIAREKV